MVPDSPQVPRNIPLIKSLGMALGWTTSSYVLLSSISLIMLLVIIVWWPLVKDYFATVDWTVPIWQQMDWLLVSLFIAMSFLIMMGADIKKDAWIVAVSIVGGFVIESWGTQTHLWNYYTSERPPLWIIPAWPVASLAIDRLTRILMAARVSILGRLPIKAIAHWKPKFINSDSIYWLVFLLFFGMMVFFVWPSLNQVATLLALAATGLLILSSNNRQTALMIFIAGSSLGYFLELWGTTRECWVYYTQQTPPLFAVLAHGFASFAFWRAIQLVFQVRQILFPRGSDRRIAEWYR